MQKKKKQPTWDDRRNAAGRDCREASRPASCSEQHSLGAFTSAAARVGKAQHTKHMQVPASCKQHTWKSQLREQAEQRSSRALLTHKLEK